MARIVMLGTYHHDPDGENRLNRALADVAPGMVICEGRAEKANGHKKYLEMLGTALAKTGMGRSRQRKWLEFESTNMYEITTSRKFCESRSIPFLYFGDSGHLPTDEERTENIEKFISKFGDQNPDKITESLRQNSKQTYDGLRKFLGKLSEFAIQYDSASDEGFGTRDQEMEDALRPIALQYPDPNFTIATVTGFRHILRDPRGVSLYSRIPDLNPERRLIG